MTTSISGGCACGAIRYVCKSEPLAMLNCHCRDCQQSSGAPFASGIIVATASLEISGTPTTYAVRGSSGNLTRRSFCGRCGTPLFTVGEVNPQLMSIRFSSLDDGSGFRPALDIWTSRAQQWVCFDPSIPHYPQSPQQ